jgi:hypothetical protein
MFLISSTGKSVFSVKPKFPLALMGQISGISPPVSPDERGGSRSSRNARWDAVDAEAATDERGFGGRRSRVVLTPRRWRQVARNVCAATVARKPVHRGEHEISRKPLRREGRMLSAEPVCSCAHLFVHIAHETAGAARTRSSLRPLIGEGGKFKANLARNARRDREGMHTRYEITTSSRP